MNPDANGRTDGVRGVLRIAPDSFMLFQHKAAFSLRQHAVNLTEFGKYFTAMLDVGFTWLHIVRFTYVLLLIFYLNGMVEIMVLWGMQHV